MITIEERTETSWKLSGPALAELVSGRTPAGLPALGRAVAETLLGGGSRFTVAHVMPEGMRTHVATQGEEGTALLLGGAENGTLVGLDAQFLPAAFASLLGLGPVRRQARNTESLPAAADFVSRVVNPDTRRGTLAELELRSVWLLDAEVGEQVRALVVAADAHGWWLLDTAAEALVPVTSNDLWERLTLLLPDDRELARSTTPAATTTA